MSRVNFKARISSEGKEVELNQEDIVRRIMIEIIEEIYSFKGEGKKELPIIELLNCKTISKDVCNLALNQLRRKGINSITKENYDTAKYFLKGYGFSEVPKLEYFEDWILRGGEETDYIGRYNFFNKSFTSYKSEKGEYVFWSTDSKIYKYSGPCYRLTKIFNNSGLQIAEVYTWGERNADEKGYILIRSKIENTRDLYQLDYKRYDGKITIGEDGSIIIDENAREQISFSIYMPVTTKDPCFIPIVEGIKEGEISDELKVFPSDKKIDSRFENDCKNNKNFSRLPEVKILSQRNK